MWSTDIGARSAQSPILSVLMHPLGSQSIHGRAFNSVSCDVPAAWLGFLPGTSTWENTVPDGKTRYSREPRDVRSTGQCNKTDWLNRHIDTPVSPYRVPTHVGERPVRFIPLQHSDLDEC